MDLQAQENGATVLSQVSRGGRVGGRPRESLASWLDNDAAVPDVACKLYCASCAEEVSVAAAVVVEDGVALDDVLSNEDVVVSIGRLRESCRGQWRRLLMD